LGLSRLCRFSRWVLGFGLMGLRAHPRLLESGSVRWCRYCRTVSWRGVLVSARGFQFLETVYSFCARCSVSCGGVPPFVAATFPLHRDAAAPNCSPPPQTIRRSSKPITSRRNRKHLSPKPFAFPPNDRQIDACARSHNEEKRVRKSRPKPGRSPHPSCATVGPPSTRAKRYNLRSLGLPTRPDLGDQGSLKYVFSAPCRRPGRPVAVRRGAAAVSRGPGSNHPARAAHPAYLPVRTSGRPSKVTGSGANAIKR